MFSYVGILISASNKVEGELKFTPNFFMKLFIEQQVTPQKVQLTELLIKRTRFILTLKKGNKKIIVLLF